MEKINDKDGKYKDDFLNYHIIRQFKKKIGRQTEPKVVY